MLCAKPAIDYPAIIILMFQHKIEFKNSLGLALSAIFEGESENDPTVILCHGYGSSKDSPISQIPFSRKLIDRGLSVFRFDFTGCGQSQGQLDDLVPTQGLDDLKCAVKTLGKKDFGLYGSSFGGQVSIWYASENPVQSLALKAPVSNYAHTYSEDIGERRQRFIENTKGLDLYEKAKNITCPVLIFHGDKDSVVPLSQSEKLAQHLDEAAQLEVLHGADHDIRGSYLAPMQTAMADFFAKNLLSRV